MNTRLGVAFLLALACALPAASVAGQLGLSDFSKVIVGKTKKDEVHAILGAPSRAGKLRTEERETWEYKYGEGRSFWVEFDPDGTVALTNVTVDFSSNKYGGP